MENMTPSHRALRICVAIALAAALVALLPVTIPREMVAPQPPFYRFEGLAWRIVQASTLAISMASLLTAALLPQAVPAPGSGRRARLAAHVASALVALIALASIGFAARPEIAPDAASAFRTQVIVLSFAALIGIAGPLALIAALALRLPARPARLMALTALALLILADIALSAGLSPLPTGGLLLALLLALSIGLHRHGILPGSARPWIIGLAAFWALPWMVARLPLAGEALMLSDPSRRYAALSDALLAGDPAHHLVGPLPLLLCLGALATLLFTPPRPRINTACAAVLSLAALFPALAAALNLGAFGPLASLDMARTGGVSAGAALAMLLAWCALQASVVVQPAIAAWLWLSATRHPR